MKAILYADDSGSHDPTGFSDGSQNVHICGYVGLVEDWVSFYGQWKRVLDIYSAQFFHFSDWNDAAAVARGRPATSNYKKNPYQGWPNERLLSLLYGLAGVIGDSKLVPVGGYFQSKAWTLYKFVIPEAPNLNPHKKCMELFYEAVIRNLNRDRPDWKNCPVSFFFDTPRDDDWGSKLCATHKEFQSKDSRIKEFTIADRRDPLHLPLQAADMLAYRINQIKRRLDVKDIPFETPKLDLLLFKNSIPDSLF